MRNVCMQHQADMCCVPACSNHWHNYSSCCVYTDGVFWQKSIFSHQLSIGIVFTTTNAGHWCTSLVNHITASNYPLV